MVKQFNISEDRVHIGLAQFAMDFNHEFYLNQHFEKEACVSHIQRLKYTSGTTNIGKALRHIEKYFDTSHGGRIGVPKILVLISDGNSDDGVLEAGVHLRGLGIIVYAIAVGDYYPVELHRITGAPKRIFPTNSFDELPEVVQKVVNEICSGDQPKPDPGLRELISVTSPLACSFSPTVFFCFSGGQKVKTCFPRFQTAALISPWDSIFLRKAALPVRY